MTETQSECKFYVIDETQAYLAVDVGDISDLNLVI